MRKIFIAAIIAALGLVPSYAGPAPVTIPTMAAFQAGVYGSYATVSLLGYYAAGDGGEGLFDKGTAGCSANNGTIVKDASNNCFYRQTNGQPYSVAWFGAKCDGTTDDTTKFSAALTAGNAIYVPPRSTGCVIDTVQVGANQSVTGAGIKSAIIAKTGADGAFLLNGDNALVSSLKITLPGPTGFYGIRAFAVQNPTVKNVTFTGSSAAALVFACDHSGGTSVGATSQNNTFDNTGQQTAMGLGVLFAGCSNFLSSGDAHFDTGGFPVETLWSSGTIDHLRTYSPDYGSSQTATASQANFTFTTSAPCGHYGLQVNSVPTYVNGTTVQVTPNGTNTSFAVLVPAQAAGVVVRFICYRQLEAISINSGSGVYANALPVPGSGSGISIISPDINGTGDTGIALACDWNWNGSTWLQTGCGGVTDLPGNVTITSPLIRNTLVSGIASYSGALGVVIDGYEITNFGLSNQNQAVLSSAITLSYIYNSSLQYSRIGSGAIDNSLGYGMNGITINGTTSVDNGDFSKQISITGEPMLKGTLPTPFSMIANLTLPDNQALVGGVNISFRQAKLYPSQPDWDTAVVSGVPANSLYWVYTKTGSGVSSDPTIKQGGNNSILTIANSYLSMVPQTEGATTSIVAGKILRFKFWAKSSANCTVLTTCSYVAFISSAAGGKNPNKIVNITSTNWKQYEVDISMQGVTYLSELRIGTPSGGVVANLQFPEVSLIDMN